LDFPDREIGDVGGNHENPRKAQHREHKRGGGEADDGGFEIQGSALGG
jgi:hypothetical protein